jgi:ribosomal protein S18 acetylase RimI-like enzyme
MTPRRRRERDAMIRGASSSPPVGGGIDCDDYDRVRAAAAGIVGRSGCCADYSVEIVSSRARALDVKVFRGFASPASEYVAEQALVGNDVSEAEAVDFLMRDHDGGGRYVMTTPAAGGGDSGGGGPRRCVHPETFFLAVYNGTEAGGAGGQYARQNGIVGVVSAQPRAPSLPGGGGGGGGVPSPHVYVANLRVDEGMRRRGVATALLSSVISWNEERDNTHDGDGTTTTTTTTPLVLSVENDNAGAIRLYKRLGFVRLERNGDYCVMIRDGEPRRTYLGLQIPPSFLIALPTCEQRTELETSEIAETGVFSFLESEREDFAGWALRVLKGFF